MAPLASAASESTTLAEDAAKISSDVFARTVQSLYADKATAANLPMIATMMLAQGQFDETLARNFADPAKTYTS